MSHRMGRRWIVFGWVALWAGSLAAETTPLPPEWRTIARRLGADDYQDRQAAEQSLRTHPNAAHVPWLTTIARGTNPEAALRAGRILDRWLATAPPEASEPAETALEELSQSEPSAVVRQARDSLAIHDQLLAQRAVTELTRMGAKIDFAPDHQLLAEWYNVRHAEVDEHLRHEAINGMLERPVGVVEAEVFDSDLTDVPADLPPEVSPRMLLPRRPAQIFFTRKWTGGAEGVRQLRRLAHTRRSVSVNVIKGSSVSLFDAQSATSEFEQLQITERGPSLGVGQTQLGFARDACYVDEVLEGGAADRAGLLPGDQIVSVADEPVNTFSELVNKVAEFDAGSRVRLEVVRETDVVFINPLFGRIPRTETKYFTVQLGDWTDVDTESRLWQSLPYLR